MPMALECFYPNDERNNGVWGLFDFLEAISSIVNEYTTILYQFSREKRRFTIIGLRCLRQNCLIPTDAQFWTNIVVQTFVLIGRRTTSELRVQLASANGCELICDYLDKLHGKFSWPENYTKERLVKAEGYTTDWRLGRIVIYAS